MKRSTFLNAVQAVVAAASITFVTSIQAATPLIQDNGDGLGVTVGAVSVTDEGGTLNVEFSVNAPYRIVQAHVDAADTCDDIPQTGSGNPKVGKFEDSWSAISLPGSELVNLTLANSWVYGDSVCIAAHAVVYDATGAVTEDDHLVALAETEESAWADGEGFPGRNWATHFEYVMPGCPCEVFDSWNNYLASGSWDECVSGPAGAWIDLLRLSTNPVSTPYALSGNLNGVYRCAIIGGDAIFPITAEEEALCDADVRAAAASIGTSCN